MKAGDVLLNGHFHVPAFEEFGEYIYMNPGSVSIPKENSAHSYMIMEENTFVWKNLEGKEYLRVEME
jgi:predicted phosphodiesterase